MTAHGTSDAWGEFCLLWLDIVRYETGVTLDDGCTYWVAVDDVVRDDERDLCRRAFETMLHRSRYDLWTWLHRELAQHFLIHAVAIREVDRIARREV